MRNLKRFLALVLAMLTLSGMMVVSATAAEPKEGDYTDAAQRLATIGILKGDGEGNLMLQSAVRRWQTALFFVQALTGTTEAEDLNAEKKSIYFDDVTEYGTAIDLAYGFNIVKGRGDGTYGYNDYIIYQDMLVMAVRALGYETPDMIYPYGHIIAAEKLGLDDNLAELNYTDPLTRGETAQIIWNMLVTPIAYKDPVSGNIVYPNEIGITDALSETRYEREYYLTRSKFAVDTIDTVIVDYKPATLSRYDNEVTVEFDGITMDLLADHLGISDETPKADYLGLPVTLYIDCKKDEFPAKYSVDPDLLEAEDGHIVFADFTDFSNVKNLGNDGAIKYVEAVNNDAAYFYLDGKRYSADKYIFDIRTLDREEGWVPAEYFMEENLLYTAKEGYIGLNSYGEVNYTVITEEVGDVKINTLLMLYMPYEFGRYASRSIRYQPTSSNMNIVTIATYTPGVTYYNFDNTKTYFVEKTLGKNGTEVNKDTGSISKQSGELSATVTVTGEEVANNDFVFYYYNEIDNVLNIAYNCGGTQSGKLTSFTNSTNTLKISGETYKYGLDGVYTSSLPEYEDYDLAGYVARQNGSKNNIHYVVYNGKVIYLTPATLTTDVEHEYLVISTKPEIMAKLLDMSVSKYETLVRDTRDVYFDNNEIKVAMLDTETATWSLQTITKVDIGSYDSSKDSYESTADLSELMGGYMISGDDFPKIDSLTDALSVLDDGIVMLRGESDGYTVAAVNDDYIDFWTTSAGLYFSDISPVTNKIKDTKDESVGTNRRTLTADSIIIVVDADGNVGIRTGIQREANSISGKGRYYKATNSLIVFKLDTAYDLVAWESAYSAEESYFISTKDSSVEIEKTDDGKYLITAENLFDLKNLDTVASIQTVVDSLSETTLDTDFDTGDVIYRDTEGKLTIADMNYGEALTAANNITVEDDDDTFYVADIDSLEFIDHESISIDLVDADGNTVVSRDKDDAVNYIDIMLSTIDLTSFESGDYNLSKIAYNEEFETYEEDVTPSYLQGITSVRLSANSDEKVYSYALSNMGSTVSLSSPTAGRLNEYIINTLGEELLIAEIESDYFDKSVSATVELAACGRFEEKEGILTLYFVKMLTDYDDNAQ